MFRTGSTIKVEVAGKKEKFLSKEALKIKK